MAEMEQSGVPTLFWGTASALFMGAPPTRSDETRVSGPYTGISKATGTQMVSRWSVVQWGTWVLATNGVDRIQIWKPSPTQTEFKDLSLAASTSDGAEPEFAELLIKFKAFVLAANTNNGTDFVDWCAEDDVSVWTPSPSNLAGSKQLRNMRSPIRAASPLGDGIAFFGDDRSVYCSFVGSPNVLGFRDFVDGTGALSKDAVTTVGRHIYGMGKHGIWRTDGVQVQYIDDPAIHDFVYAGGINREQLSQVIAWWNPAERMIVFFFPEPGSDFNSRGVGFNVDNNSWTILGFGRTAATSSTAFRFPVTADQLGNIFQQSISEFPFTSDGIPVALQEVVTIAQGYGIGGYAQGGYGGFNTGNVLNQLAEHERKLLQQQFQPGDVSEFTKLLTDIVTANMPASGFLTGSITRTDQIDDTPIGTELDSTFAFVETDDLEFSQEGQDGHILYKYISDLVLELSDKDVTQNLFLIIKYRDSLAEPLKELEAIRITGTDHSVKMPLELPNSIYYRFRLEDRRVDKRWRLASMQVNGEYAGRAL
jgi:hypothetical protein